MSDYGHVFVEAGADRRTLDLTVLGAVYRGESLYELAVRMGFVGSEEDFLLQNTAEADRAEEEADRAEDAHVANQLILDEQIAVLADINELSDAVADSQADVTEKQALAAASETAAADSAIAAGLSESAAADSAAIAVQARDEVESMGLDRVYADDTAALADLAVGDYYRIPSAEDGEIFELHKITSGPTATDTGKRFSDNSAWSTSFGTAVDEDAVIAFQNEFGFQASFLGVDYLQWAGVRLTQELNGFAIRDFATNSSVLAYDNSTEEFTLQSAHLVTDDAFDFPLGLIDENGFVVDLAKSSETSTSTTPPIPVVTPVTIEPIYSDEFFAFSSRPVPLYADGLLDGRSASRVDAMISWSSYPFDMQGSTMFNIDTSRLGETTTLSIRRITSDIDKRHEMTITNRIASGVGTGTSGNVAIIGDSISNRMLPDIVDDLLTDFGYNITWVGTVPSARTTDNSDATGPLAEAREGRAFADYIYSTTYNINDSEVTVMADTPTETTNYNNGSKSYKVARIPMLRPELPGDDPSIVFNGYVFDYGRYLTRFGLADPDVVVCLLGTNDSNEDTGADPANRCEEGIRVMHADIRSALPDAHIVFGMPAPARTAILDTNWMDERAAMLKRFVSTIRELRLTDTDVHYLAAHAHMTQEVGWLLGDEETVVDPDTGITVADVTDAVHPRGICRNQLAEQVAAAIAWCLEN